RLTAVPWGDSDSARVGDWVMAVGNPFGLGSTVTTGVVSARGRVIGQGPYDDFIQTDAAINRGNSGGPSFNLNGDVIGVNTAIFSPSGGSVGIGFMIPANLARDVIEKLQDDGEVERGWLGVRIQPVTDDIQASLDLPAAEGALISEVTGDGPAERAGIEIGDVVVGFNDKPVDSPRALSRAVASEDPGARAVVDVIREGRRRAISVTLGDLSELDTQVAARGDGGGAGPVAREETLDDLGVTLAPATAENRRRFNAADGDGVIVSEVENGSTAAETGLQRGDVIRSINRSAVDAPSDVADAIADARRDDRQVVLMRVARPDGEIFIPLRLQGS
ncbi:MAG: PDZ domain-containing protein, partial [Pseudomonadota bacterium]